MKLKTMLGWLAVALLLFFAIKNPAGAASVVHHIGGFLSSIARGFRVLLEML